MVLKFCLASKRLTNYEFSFQNVIHSKRQHLRLLEEVLPQRIEAAQKSITSIHEPGVPTYDTADATTDRAGAIVNTVRNLIDDAYVTIWVAKKEVEVAHVNRKKNARTIESKVYKLENCKSLATIDIDEIAFNLKIEIYIDQHSQQRLKAQLNNHVRQLGQHYVRAINCMMNSREFVCIECVIPPYKTSTDVSVLFHRLTLLAKSATTTANYRDVCLKYVKTYNIEAIESDVISTIRSITNAVRHRIKPNLPKFEILDTAATNALDRAVKSILRASKLCFETDKIFTGLSAITNELNEQYERYKSEMNAVVERLIGDLNAVSCFMRPYTPCNTK